MMRFRSNIVLGLFLLTFIHLCLCVSWERLRCASDSKQDMTDGIVDDIGRFPWLGIVQHDFYIAGKTHFAITGAVLIHPAYAIAPAEDIAKILPDQLINNTKLILWSNEKYAMDVKDYVLHPQYETHVTYATIALLDLVAWGENELSEWQAPVLPVCMPIKGSGTFGNLYTVKMNDESGKMQKEAMKMKFVGDQDCEEFYYKAELSYQKMNPVNPICAVSENAKKPCVWDGGAALITRQSWGYWKLLGFAVRGPGCGAPTRFLNIHDYLPWIDDVISNVPLEDYKGTYKIGLRRVSPIKLIMYKANEYIPKQLGECNRKLRGSTLFKDSSELLVNKDFVQGFYFLVITQMAEFRCAEINLLVSRRTNAALWLEHNCHRESFGLAANQPRPNDITRATIDMALFGKVEDIKIVPNPFRSSQHTTGWWPTPDRMRMYYFVPRNVWWYDL